MKRLTFAALGVLLVLGMALPSLAQGPVLDAAQAYFAEGTKNIKADALYENLHDGDTSNDPFILDTRKAEDFAKAHIPGAVNMSVGTLFTAQGWRNCPRTRTSWWSAAPASQVTAALNMLGCDAYSLHFGMPAWAMVEGVSAGPFDPSKSMNYAVEGTAAAPAALGAAAVGAGVALRRR